MKKEKLQCLAVGAFVVYGMQPYSTATSSENDVFSVKETRTMQPCYWLSREIPAEGLCGEKMRPDINVLSWEAEKGNAIAAMRLGQLYASGDWGTKKDLVKAIQWYSRAADLGDRYSQLRLAQAYEFGRMGVQVDARLAIKYYNMATEGGIYPDLEERITVLKMELAR